MASIALERWMEYVGDPQDLLARFEAALDAADPGPGALGRAVYVFLAAAWETYVEELAREAAAIRVAAGLLPPVQGTAVEKGARRLHNPTVDQVGPLLRDALGEDPWVRVSAPGMTEAATRRMINNNQLVRHRIAHGAERFLPSRNRLAARVALFNSVVASVDGRARSVLRTQLGRDPW